MTLAAPPWKLADLAELCAARCEGGEAEIEFFEAWPAGGPRCLVLAESQEQADSVAAAALLCGPTLRTPMPTLRTDSPRAAFGVLCGLLAGQRWIHPQSVVSAGARLADGVHIGPGAVVEPGTRLEERVSIGACAYIGAGVTIGPRSRVAPGAVILEGTVLGPDVEIQSGAVIGSRGFGYVFHKGAHQPIPQVGGVEIGAGSRIGAGTCIDRGTTAPTSVGAGVAVGPLSQLAHNVQLGDGVSVGSQVGIAGSCRVEAECTLGNQVGMAPHSVIGRGARLADRAGNTRGVVPPGAHMVGFPARPREGALRVYAALNRLDWILARLGGTGGDDHG